MTTSTNTFSTVAEAIEAKKSLRLISRTGTVHSMTYAMLIIDSPGSKPRYYRGEDLGEGETVRIETNRSNCGAMGQIHGMSRHGIPAGITEDEVTCKRCSK